MSPHRILTPLKRGDYIRFAHLPKTMEVTPIAVTAVAKNGMVELSGRGWFQSHLLEKVLPPAKLRKRAS